jgi:hypothetical protein
MQSTTKASSGRRVAATRGAESGMALIMAILALVLLTAIGMTLATSTSTEVQVAANYRWQMQALHNAEAGIEVAKTVLVGDEWTKRLTQRAAWTPGDGALHLPSASVPVVDPPSTRDWENGRLAGGTPSSCDPLGGGVGYGKVMGDDNNPGITPSGLLEDVTHYPPTAPLSQYLNGSFTVWYRWALTYNDNGTVKDFQRKDSMAGVRDYPSDVMIVVSEGVAPAQTATGTRAVQVVEATVYGPMQKTPCDAGLTSQAGSGPGGAGMNPCDRIGDTIQISVPGGGVIVGQRNR